MISLNLMKPISVYNKSGPCYIALAFHCFSYWYQNDQYIICKYGAVQFMYY